MDVKARAAMFGAKKADPPPIIRRNTTQKIAVAGVFGAGANNKGDTISQSVVNKVEDKKAEIADQQPEKPKSENPFMKKTTVKLDQDKSKFVSENAKEENEKITNPFLKTAEKKLNPFEQAQQKKKEEDAAKAAAKPAVGEKKVNPFEAAQQKRKEEEAAKAALKPAIGEKKMNPFELAQQKKKEEEAAKAASKPAVGEKKMNPFELAQQKRKAEAEEKQKAADELKAKNAPKKLDPSQMIQIPSPRKGGVPQILVRQPTMDQNAEDEAKAAKKAAFAEQQKKIAEMLSKPKAKKEPPKLDKEKISANIFDEGDDQPHSARLPTATLGMDTLLNVVNNKPTLTRERRTSQRYQNKLDSESD